MVRPWGVKDNITIHFMLKLSKGGRDKQRMVFSITV